MITKIIFDETIPNEVREYVEVTMTIRQNNQLICWYESNVVKSAQVVT